VSSIVDDGEVISLTASSTKTKDVDKLNRLGGGGGSGGWRGMSMRGSGVDVCDDVDVSLVRSLSVLKMEKDEDDEGEAGVPNPPC